MEPEVGVVQPKVIPTQTQQTEPETTPTATPEVKTPDTNEDILSRVTKFVDSNAGQEAQKQDSTSFNSQELEETIDKIESPELKEQMMGLRKSLLRGANDKFQEVAQLRKEMQEFMSQGKTWTPERIQSLLNDPNFVAEAQKIAGVSPNTDDYSTLTDAEQGKFANMEKELLLLKQMNMNSIKTNQDEVFTKKYANYNPVEIDQLFSDMTTGKVQATREHLYKVIHHDTNVKNAYEMGRKDEREGIGEKIISSSTQGISTNATTSLQPEKDESSQSFWNRIITKNLAASRK